MYAHFAIRRSATLLAISPKTDIIKAIFTMDVYGQTGLVMSVPAQSCPDAQDRTTYPPIRGSFLVTAPLHITRIRLSFGETTLFDKAQDARVEPGYQFTIDWLLGTDELPENEYQE